MAWDKTTNTLGYFVVSDEIAHRDPLIVTLVIDGETIYTTWAHPFWVEGKGWVAAGKLTLGDHVRRAEGESGVVSQILVFYLPQVMYNLTVAGAFVIQEST